MTTYQQALAAVAEAHDAGEGCRFDRDTGELVLVGGDV